MRRALRASLAPVLALALATEVARAVPMMGSVAPQSDHAAGCEAVPVPEYTTFAQDPMHAFDMVLNSPLDVGSGVYYEFDTQFSEVVRTGQAGGKQEVNANSPLPLASASKLFTGLAAMRTMQLKPHEFSPEKYIYEFEGWHDFRDFAVEGSDERANINIHQLLTHTSGLPFCLKCSREDVKNMQLFYKPGTYFGYTLGHRLVGWLLRDFWKSQPEGRAAGIKTVQDTYQWLVFSKLGLTPNTCFIESLDVIFGYSGDAGDASISSTGEDMIKLAVVALRRGALPSGEQLISEHNWNRWAVPNLLPEGKLTCQLVGWRASSETWQNTIGGDDVRAKIMRQHGEYGWNYFGATYYDSREIGWCGFFSSCLRVTYAQNVAFVMIQENVADLEKSKPFLVSNFDAMARSLQCKDVTCDPEESSTTFCQRATATGQWILKPWTPSCPSVATVNALHSMEVAEKRHVCYKPTCTRKGCARRTGHSCHLASCPISRTACEDGECVCAPGFCAVDGVCVPTATCRQDTGGTCGWLGCDSSRGPTYCAQDKCLCRPGYCEADGQCVPKAPVINETCIGPVGSCVLLGCDASRGPTVCLGGSCLCKEGFCPSNGRCIPLNRPAGTLQDIDFFEGSGYQMGQAAVGFLGMVVLFCAGAAFVGLRRRRWATARGGMTASLLGNA